MRAVGWALMLAGIAWAGHADDFGFEQRLDMKVGDKVWLSTITTPYDAARREQTYKVYTHIYDFDGGAPITKGEGGLYPHHRGLFIGWKDTVVGDKHYNIWEMPNTSQRHVAWQAIEAEADHGRQVEEINWCDDAGKALIKEIREITARPGENGVRLIDFGSELATLAGPIQLRGDLQHAGMQVRLAQEVAEHQDTTQYILPEGAEEQPNDKVVGAWWMTCSAEIRGKRYWVMHMTPPKHPYGIPVYSIRRYARFGAFFEPDLKEGETVKLRFRVVVSDHELSREACAGLYEQYAKGTP